MIPKEKKDMKRKEKFSSDIDAVKAFTEGDQSAFNYLYHKHYTYVYDFASKRLNYNKGLASDISSQTFVNFYKYAGRFNIHYNIKLGSFLCEIANNLIIDNYRKLQRQVELNGYSLSACQNDSGELTIRDTSCLSPEKILDRKIVSTILYSQIAKLDTISNKILIYFYKEEMTYQEICTKLDLPLHLVKTKLFRAKQKLRCSLRNSGLRYS